MYYAVKNGRNKGIYNTWIECEQQVKGYSNAMFKKFNSYEDAKNYLLGEITIVPEQLDGIHIYCDGSFIEEKQIASYAFVIVDDNKIIYEEAKPLTNKKFNSSRNIYGEFFGALVAVKKAKELNYNNINLYYDYSGIKNFADGTWKPQKGISEFYKKVFDSLQVNVNFIKVKGHSGNYYNDYVDKLAKNVLTNN